MMFQVLALCQRELRDTQTKYFEKAKQKTSKFHGTLFFLLLISIFD